MYFRLPNERRFELKDTFFNYLSFGRTNSQKKYKILTIFFKVCFNIFQAFKLKGLCPNGRMKKISDLPEFHVKNANLILEIIDPNFAFP